MARPAPSDLSYTPSFALQLDGTADTDLTTQFTEAPCAANAVLVSNEGATAQDLVVRLQGAPTVDVNFRIVPGGMAMIRGAFVSHRAATGIDIRATFMWHGGPA